MPRMDQQDDSLAFTDTRKTLKRAHNNTLGSPSGSALFVIHDHIFLELLKLYKQNIPEHSFSLYYLVLFSIEWDSWR